jgi:hypothetical protein
MGTSQDGPGRGRRGMVTAACYLLLFFLGALEGLIGSFQYGDSPVPVIAIILDVLIFATCVLAGWGLRTYGAGILPALGWIVASFVLASQRANGSVIITASLAGEWYLYGGALAALAGAAAAFYGWARTRRVPG